MLSRFPLGAATVSSRRSGGPGRLVAFAVLGVCMCVSSFASEFNPAPTEPAAGVDNSSGRVIVKFRGTVAIATAAQKAATESIATQKVAALSARSGITFKQSRRLGPALQVLEIAAPATSANMDANLAILRADPDVEFAEPDLRRFPHARAGRSAVPGPVVSAELDRDSERSRCGGRMGSHDRQLGRDRRGPGHRGSLRSPGPVGGPAREAGCCRASTSFTSRAGRTTVTAGTRTLPIPATG